MTEGLRSDERPSDALVEIVRKRHGLDLSASTEAWAGEESMGWRAPSADGDRFVQRFPAWRSADELAWCDAVATAAAKEAPACVHAIPDGDGRVVIETDNGPVMVFPFVDGRHPSEEDRSLAPAAAALLASIHLSISAAAGIPDEPPGRRPIGGGTDAAHDGLVDHDLDRWERSLSLRHGPRPPIHGDFYGGNLLVSDGTIVGVIDWSEARVEHLEQEVAWAMWEFCQGDPGDDLVDADAERFLTTYIDAGGPAGVAPPFDPVPWVRRRLRWEASAWFGDPRSRHVPSSYHEAQLRAFDRLRERTLPGRGR